MKRKRKISVILICTLLIGCLAFALLLPETLGKYTSDINGYIDFNIGRFNAAITQTNVSEDANVSSFVEYSMYDFKPGMNSKELDNTLEADTAATTKFRVSNGTTAQNAAGVTLEYVIRIRTSNSLPLKYTLKSVMEPTVEGGEETVVYHTISAPPEVITQPLAEPRYEYSFSDGSSLALAEEGESDSPNTDEEETEQPPIQYSEIKFRLSQGTADNPVVFREHELIAEWSSDEEFAQSKYMKEVEIVEIVVTVTSVNSSEGDGYEFPDNPITDNKSSGIIVMLPSADLAPDKYDYQIDLRSFALDDGDNVGDYIGAFNLILHNGFGQGLTNSAVRSATYNMKLKIPATLIEAKGDDKWLFSVYRNDDPNFTSNLMSGAKITYQLRDMKNGTYTDYDDRNAVPVYDEKQFMLFAVYELKLEQNNILNYMQQNTAGNYEIVLEKHGYTIRANKTVEVTDELAFLNKLEITVDASFTSIPAPQEPLAPPESSDENEAE